MKLDEIFQYIEGERFDAVMNAASGLSVFHLGLARDETIAELVKYLHQDKQQIETILKRIIALLETYEDRRFAAQRYDAAIGAYLYALHQVDNEMTQRAIDVIAQIEHLFWAKRMAQHIQEARQEAK